MASTFRGPVCILESGGPTIRIESDGREWHFEFDNRFGPTLLSKRNESPLKNQPVSEKHPFWKPFTLWLKQGQRVDESGCAIWEDKPVSVRRVAVMGRNVLSESIAAERGTPITHELHEQWDGSSKLVEITAMARATLEDHEGRKG